MNFIKNNSTLIVLTLVIAGMFVMTAGLAAGFRGGNAWAF